MRKYLYSFLLSLTMILTAQVELSTQEIVERAQLALKVQGLQGVNTMIIIDEYAGVA